MIKKICFFLFVFFLSIQVQAATPFLHQGSGEYELTLYHDSTIDDVLAVYKEAKLITPSPFGGSAYSFYTDDNYNNYFYVETLSDGRIASFVTVMEGYTTDTYSYGDDYNYKDLSLLKGLFYNDSGTIKGGAFYNKRLSGYSSSSLLSLYKTNYEKDLYTYKKSDVEHGVLMYNAVRNVLGKNNYLEFYEEGFDLAYTYQENGMSLRSTLMNSEGKRFLYQRTDTDYKNSTYFTVSPFFYAMGAYSTNLSEEYTTAMFYYDESLNHLWSFAINDELKSDIEMGSLTSQEIDERDLLVEQHTLYFQESIDYGLTEQEVIEKAFAYSQDGNLYGFNGDHQTYYGVLVDHSAVCGGYMNTLYYLSGLGGAYCTEIIDLTRDHGYNLCNVDGVWSYFDVGKRGIIMQDYAMMFTQNSGIAFKTKSYLKNLTYVFDSNTYDSHGYIETLPEGVEIESSYHSYPYYDEFASYYLRSFYEKINNDYQWVAYLMKEDRQNNTTTRMLKVLKPRNNGSGLAKENDTLYYVSENYELCSINTDGTNQKRLVTKTSSREVYAVFVRDGDLYYTTENPTTKEVELVKYKDLNTWPEVKKYTLDHSKYAYDLLYLEGDYGITILRAVGLNNMEPSGDIFIPDFINDKPVIGIAANAYYLNNTSFTGDLVLPESVLYVGKFAFAYNDKIKSITLNNKLKSIGQAAFHGMSGVSGTLIIPDSVTFVDYLAFGELGISEVVISDNLRMLPKRMFMDNTKLTEVTFGESVAVIGEEAFRNCASLKSVSLPESIEYIYSDAFKGASNLQDIVIYGKEIEAMGFTDTSATIYLHGSSKTGVYARTNRIDYIDLDTMNGTITLNYSSLNVNYGSEPVTLSYTVSPSIYENNTYTWKSANPSIASVDNTGVVTFHNVGSTTITLSGDNGLSKSLVVTVNQVKVSDFYLNKTEVYLAVGETFQLKSLILPEEVASTQTLTWSYTDSSVAIVDFNGLITARGLGDTAIKARLSNGEVRQVEVHVVEEYLLNDPQSMLYLEGLLTQKISLNTNLGNTEYLVNISSSNPLVATSNGESLTLKGGGFTTVKGTTSLGDVELLIYVNTPITLSMNTVVYPGDLNNDTFINQKDYLLLKQKIGSTTEDDLKMADINSDDKIDETDLQWMVSLILNESIVLDVEYPDIEIQSVFPQQYLNYQGIDDVSFKGTSLWVNYHNYTNFHLVPVTWISSNPEVASVDETGQVTYHQSGYTLITAKLDDEHTDTLELYLSDEPISFDQEVYTIKVGEMVTPVTTQPYTNRNNSSNSYYSQNDEVATYQNGVLTGISPGTTTITFHVDNSAVTAIVVVSEEENETTEEYPIEEITFSEETLHILKGEIAYLSVDIIPYYTTMDTTITYQSSNPNVVSVSENGIINALESGDAIITATSSNNKTAQIIVSVEEGEKEITSISAQSSYFIPLGSQVSLNASVMPTDTTMDKTLTYQISDPSIASVTEDGSIKGLKNGSTTIVITASNGISKTVNVNVITESDALKGDINLNGKIEVTDFVLGLRYFIGTYAKTEDLLYVYDMNNNGKKEMVDAILILRKFLNT